MSPPKITELALAAKAYVQRAIAVEVDDSVESLAYVDLYIASVGELKPEVLALTAAALGAWFGELWVAHRDAVWHADDEDPATWMVAIPGPDERSLLAFHPVALAAAALVGGDVDGYDASLRAPAASEARLAELLADAAPVDAAFYYSLTGRWEAIEHITDLVLELRRTTPGEN